MGYGCLYDRFCQGNRITGVQEETQVVPEIHEIIAAVEALNRYTLISYTCLTKLHLSDMFHLSCTT